MKTVIYHSADFDGIFCREIAKHFLGEKDVQYIGWNFGDPPVFIHVPPLGDVYFLDLPVDQPMAFDFRQPVTVIERFGSVNAIKEFNQRLIWIDHHKSSIESHPTDIPGYRIDVVAACRLAWQWFSLKADSIGIIAQAPDQVPHPPSKVDFIDRKVSEPLAVRLAGEYDVWDKRDPRAEVFQHGLRSMPLSENQWSLLLVSQQKVDGKCDVGTIAVGSLIEFGNCVKYAQENVWAGYMKASFLIEWEGLKFLCLNGRGNSNTFASRDVPETGHDALLMFAFMGREWIVSLYHAKHRTDLDLSQIAVKYGGGGHKGACGFTCKQLPFLT